MKDSVKVEFVKGNVTIRLDYRNIIVFWNGNSIFKELYINDLLLVRLQYLSTLKTKKSIDNLVDEIVQIHS